MPVRSPSEISLLMSHGIDIPNRTIYLTSYPGPRGNEEPGVDWRMADRVMKGLDLIEDHPDLPIKLIINSPGGEDDHTRAIIAALRRRVSPIHGIVYGRAESAAAWILQHCTRRIMDRGSNLMLHMGTPVRKRDPHDRRVDDQFVEDVLARMLVADPDYSERQLRRKLLEDWYVYPDEAVELGLADEVI